MFRKIINDYIQVGWKRRIWFSWNVSQRHGNWDKTGKYISRNIPVSKSEVNEEDLIKSLNPKITGWKNYYTTKASHEWMMSLDWCIICTFLRWYNKKYQRRHRMSKVGFVRSTIYEKDLKWWLWYNVML